MMHYFIIPGYQGSGENHWQTWMEAKSQNFHRIQQRDWEQPNIDEWVENINKAIENYNPESVVLVAHSLGCLTVAEWVKKYNKTVRAALLVAPPDTNIIRQRLSESLFSEEPVYHFPFQSTLVASSNDPWITIDKAKFYAEKWGSEFINIGDAGHINTLSGYGVWEQGYEILKKVSA